MWWLIGFLAALAAAGSNDLRSSAPSPPGTAPLSPARAMIYRSRDGSAFFRFQVTQSGDGVRIHILEFPNPQVGSCHVLHDSHGPYICWSQVVRSVAEAKAVAAIWAEATLVYQRTGRTF